MNSSFVLNGYQPLLTLPVDDIASVGITHLIPQFPKEVVMKLCDEATRAFIDSDVVLRVSSPVKVVGDIHGSLHDLLRILNSDPTGSFLFLGDYVDRGNFSLEVIILLFALVSKFPQRFYLLRGNHEFESIASVYGFQKEVFNLYRSDDVFQKFMEAFSYMPIGAIINENYLCIHGGISPHFTNMRDLEELVRPIVDFENNIVSDALWGDPDRICLMYNESQRGHGFSYGAVAVKDFLEKNKLSVIIRGHECVNGTKSMFNNTVITVFSSSDYQKTKNESGILDIDESGAISTVCYDAYPKLKRNDAYVFMLHNPVLCKPITPKVKSLSVTNCLKSYSFYNCNADQLKRSNSKQFGIDTLKQGRSIRRLSSISRQALPTLPVKASASSCCFNESHQDDYESIAPISPICIDSKQMLNAFNEKL